MTYRNIIIVPSVLATIRREAQSAPRTETGGALVGYATREDEVILTHASGPGPRAELARDSVLIDGEYTTAFCNLLYHNSCRQLDYVGDWHRHLGFSVEYSQRDLTAMLDIRASKCCCLSYPVSLIYRRRPERLVGYALVADSLIKVPVQTLRDVNLLRDLRQI